jgi:hypothetical protein
MDVIVWLLEFIACWLVCVLVITKVDPLVTRFSAWIDISLLKRDPTVGLVVSPVENRVEDPQARR